MNVLLIDDAIADLNIFTNGINDKTKYIIYNYGNTFVEIKNKVDELMLDTFDTLGFVFYDNHMDMQMFLESQFFKQSDKILEFIKNLVEIYKVKTIDFLACNLLNYPSWKDYFALLNKSFGVDVRASNDKTGNIVSGGDWILETSNVNIFDIYFTDKIKLWNHVLDFSNQKCIIATTNELTQNIYISGTDNYSVTGTETSYISKLKNYSELNEDFVDKKIISVCVGYNNEIFILTDEPKNNLYGCGVNQSNMFGIENEPNIIKFQNICLSDLSNVIFDKKIIVVSCGYEHTGIIDSNNILYMCGNNSTGHLGLGHNTNVSLFTKINSMDRKAINVICGYRTTAVITNEEIDNLYTCGLNNQGQLGIGSTENTNTFQKLELNKKVLDAKYGYYHLIMITNETKNNYYVCGKNDVGQFGNGQMNYSTHSSFENINIDNKYIREIYAGDTSSIVLTNGSKNNMYVAGYDSNGYFGLGFSNAYFQNFTKVSTNDKIDLAGFGPAMTHSFICSSTNSLYSSGNNQYGQLGLASSTSSIKRFEEIKFNKKIKKIICCMNMTFVITSELNNNLYICGGTNNLSFGSVRVSIFNKSKFDKKVMKSIASVQNIMCITDEPYNNLYYTGKNLELSISKYENKFTLFKSPNIHKKKITNVSAGLWHCVLLTNELKNNIYGIGYSCFGLPSSSVQYKFQNIGLSTDSNLFDKQIIKISCGSYFTHVITSDNKLYSTGQNSYGQLGLNDRIDKTNFETLNNDVIDVSAGQSHSLIITNALKNNCFSCGLNGSGELGINGNTNDIQQTFTNVNTSQNSLLYDKKVVNIYAGYSVSFVLTSDSSNNLYSCGFNNAGQLGLNNTTNKNKFTLVQHTLAGKSITGVNLYLSCSAVTTSETTNNFYVCGEDNGGILGLSDDDNISNGTYYSTFQNIESFGDKIISFNTYQHNKKIYVNVPIDINIYSTEIDAELKVEEIESEVIPDTFVKTYEILPSLSKFDKYISFTIKAYSVTFTIYFTVNSVDYLVTTDKTQFVYYKTDDNIKIYTKMSGTLKILFI